MTDHEPVDGCPLEIRSKAAGRPDGFYAACTCSWTGPERKWPSTTLVDLNKHQREMK